MAPADLLHVSGVVLVHQFGNGLAQVPEEAIGEFEALDRPAREDRQPGARIIAAPFGKLLGHSRGPVLRPDLPTVDVGHAQGPGPKGFLVGQELADEPGEVGLDRLPAQLVALRPDALGRGRRVAGPGGRVAEAEHGPPPLGHVPGKAPAGVQLRRQLDHLPARQGGVRGRVRAAGRRKRVLAHVAGLAHDLLQTRAGVQRHVAHGHAGAPGRVGRLEDDPEEPSGNLRKAHRRLRPASGQRAHSLELPTVRRGQQLHVAARVPRRDRERHGPGGHRCGEIEVEDVRLAGRGVGQRDGGRRVAVHEPGRISVLEWPVRGQLGFAELHRRIAG